MGQYQDCYYEYKHRQFKIGNQLIERIIDFSKEFPCTTSLVNKQDRSQWIERTQSVPIPMFYFPFLRLSKHPAVHISSAIDNDLGIGKEYLEVVVSLQYQKIQIQIIFKIYSKLPFIRQSVRIKAEESSSYEFQMPKEQIELDENKVEMKYQQLDYFDQLSLNELHCRWETIISRDITDRNNNLISKEYGLLYTSENRKVQGNILILQKNLRDSGLILVKEGPTSLASISDVQADFQFIGKDIYVVGSGIRPMDLRHNEFIETYSTAIGVFQGGEYAYLKLLHGYHQARHQEQPNRDFFIMSNTWGDRSKDGRVCEAFILEELEKAKDLGITHVQVDDGWQQGTTSNSVQSGGTWGDYYSNEEIKFWDVHPERFPNGLEPIVDRAREYDIQLGLWFSPDSTNDFFHWEEDSNILIELYKKYHIPYFKMDGIKITSKYGQMNLGRMLKKVVKETKGKVYFNLDTTAQIRLGYFCDTQYSSLFLENRYTDFGNYYPHWTLRNLWMLSRYVPAQKFQIEFLNVERNQKKYGDDPLSPATCGIAYAFAVTMFANPLVWMELTGLGKESTEILSKMIKEYKRIQKYILEGHILPIGEEPQGMSWTGFQSILDEQRGYVIIFREHTASSEGRIPLWTLKNRQIKLVPIMKMEERNKVKIGEEIWKKEEVRALDGSGTCSFSLQNTLSFVLYRYEVQA